MKKHTLRLLAVFLVASMALAFAACGKATDDPTTTNTTASTTTAPKTTADPLEQVQIHVEKYTEGDRVSVEYLSVTGLPDENVQNELNEAVKEFFLWQWLVTAPDAEPDNATYVGKATYELDGSLLTVTRTLDAVLESGTDPVQSVDKEIFNLLDPSSEPADESSTTAASEVAVG
ncbi:MAG: hypothetical protein LBC83_08485 [Oscillospiraceae bacterium]|nr:hypothetical protein [Oscillospiraceae bacterium]